MSKQHFFQNSAFEMIIFKNSFFFLMWPPIGVVSVTSSGIIIEAISVTLTLILKLHLSSLQVLLMEVFEELSVTLR